MASLILLSNLPLATSNVGNTSVYQGMLETIMKENTITDLKLADICAAIRTTWASHFGHLKPSEQPRKGTFYYNEPKGKGRTDEHPAPRPQAQRNTAIKDKGPAPKHSEQQQQQKAPAASNSRRKRPFCRSNRGGQKKASARVAAPSSDFLIASAAITIADQPSQPAPTAHTVAHIAPTSITTRREFEQGSSRLLGTAPYPTFQRSRSLMSRLGVTPTIEQRNSRRSLVRRSRRNSVIYAICSSILPLLHRKMSKCRKSRYRSQTPIMSQWYPGDLSVIVRSYPLEHLDPDPPMGPNILGQLPRARHSITSSKVCTLVLKGYLDGCPQICRPISVCNHWSHLPGTGKQTFATG